MSEDDRHLQTALLVDCKECSLFSIWGGDVSNDHPHEESGHEMDIMAIGDAIDYRLPEKPLVEVYNYQGYE